MVYYVDLIWDRIIEAKYDHYVGRIEREIKRVGGAPDSEPGLWREFADVVDFAERYRVIEDVCIAVADVCRRVVSGLPEEELVLLWMGTDDFDRQRSTEDELELDMSGLPATKYLIDPIEAELYRRVAARAASKVFDD